MTPNLNLWLIPVLPLIGAALNGFFGKRLTREAVAILTLVLANNYLLMFIGWEGVGLASYLLIGFFFLRDSAASAGKKAFIVNRVGDFGFLIALFLLIKHFGSLDFEQVFQHVSSLNP